MLCILTVTNGADGNPMRNPILSNRTEDTYPGFTSWNYLKTLQAQWKDDARKQREHIGISKPVRSGKGKGAGGKQGEGRADARTPQPGSRAPGQPGDMGAGGVALEGIDGKAQFRNSSNPYAI